MKFEFSPHIAVGVSQYQRAVEFYQGVLGMDLKHRKEGETELACGAVTFYIEDDPARRTWLEFRVADVEAARMQLEEAGCQLSPTSTPEGERSYMVTDPFGMRFHVYQG
jgi:catechol 2,3-dioxygenase-like lactoylglutathione lyase family enzyme